jgi:hypothetical protein
MELPFSNSDGLCPHIFLYVNKRNCVAIGPKSKDKKNHKRALRPCNWAMAELSKANVPHPTK